MINITERITALRLERKWSEYQLAEKIRYYPIHHILLVQAKCRPQYPEP